MSAPVLAREIGGSALHAGRARPRWLVRAARERLFARLTRLRWGRLTFRDQLGHASFGGAVGPQVTVDVRELALYLEVALRGTVGAGEAYVRGAWNCDDLVGIARIFARNREVMGAVEGGLARLATALLRWTHARRDNTRSGSRANIAAHYDLGNEFYALLLDETMMYSCALYERADMSLEHAQLARLERICRKLQLSPSDHLLEIGSGWGGMALYAAREYGCRVTTTTISRRQFEFASERIARAGLTDRVTVVCRDYRDLEGRFDKLVSLEMIEAVGERWLDAYFAKCSTLLEPHGAMLLQSITIRDQHYDAALRSVDFIQRHVFPGACIPSLSAILERVKRCTDFSLFHLDDLGPHYARTLRAWRANFDARREQVRALGYSDEFQRLWEFYLCYCEGGFEERVLGDVQLLLTKPDCRRAPLAGEQH
ncbi:MAG: class I SAM-dependent methyltransferase [Planctomycetes bacterium]|nr:class I SAM-dependent methyltransferase [Planctomycetota bacterium]